MPRIGFNKQQVGQSFGQLTGGLLGGFNSQQNAGRLAGMQSNLVQAQTENIGMDNQMKQRELNRDPVNDALVELGITGHEAESVRSRFSGMPAPQIPDIDPEIMKRAGALINVFSRGGKVDDLTKAIGESNRNVIGRSVNPDNVADVGAMIGATEGKPLEGVKAQLTSGIAQGKPSENLVKALLAASGKGTYDAMSGGVYNVDSGEQNLNTIGNSMANENNAQARQADAGAQENLAQAQHALMPPPMRGASGVNVNSRVKPQLPVAALKMVNEELDAIGSASGTVSDLSKLNSQIENGDLDLGLVNNAENYLRNATGISNTQSKNYDSFNATLEKLRNETLNLAKGPQTEGDAQRAWKQLISRPNDNENVKAQLKRISEIVDRAVMIKKNNVNNVYNNFGGEPFDFSNYENANSGNDIKPDQWDRVDDPQKAIENLRNDGQVEEADRLQEMVDSDKAKQATVGNDENLTIEDLQHTADKYGMTIEEVKAQLGVK